MPVLITIWHLDVQVVSTVLLVVYYACSKDVCGGPQAGSDRRESVFSSMGGHGKELNSKRSIVTMMT